MDNQIINDQEKKDIFIKTLNSASVSSQIKDVLYNNIKPEVDHLLDTAYKKAETLETETDILNTCNRLDNMSEQITVEILTQILNLWGL